MTDSRLKIYALTAGGTAALAAAGAASAGIVSSSGGPISIATNASPTTLFTLGGDAVGAENTMSGSWSNTVTNGFAYARILVQGGVAATVSAGASIASGFSGSSGSIFNSMTFISGGMASNNSFLPLGESLLVGIASQAGSGAYYGWVNYTLSMERGEYTFFINSWAYNDVAGQGIIAGQNTAVGSTAVPGLGGLAALAIGAAGVRSRRQRAVA